MLNSVVGAVVQWKYYANNTNSILAVSDTYNLTTTSVTDTTPPAYYAASIWSNVSNNTAVNVGTSVRISAQWYDNVQPSVYTNSSAVNGTNWAIGTWQTFSAGNWSNFTIVYPSSAQGGNFTVKIYANDSSNNQNVTGTWYWYNVSGSGDTIPPQYSGIQTSNPSSYSSQATWMNITWIDNYAVSQVKIESNYSGSPQNYTPTQSGSVYYLNLVLPGGVFYWKSYSVDTSSNWNTSTTQTFTISKASPGLVLTSSKSITYGSAAAMTGTTSDSGNSDCIYELYRSGSLYGSGTSVTDNTILGAGSYPYYYSTAGCANYTSGSSPTNTLTVNQASRTCTLSTDKGWTRAYDGTASSTTCSVSDGNTDGTMTFTMNAGSVSTPDLRSNAGTYNYVCQWGSGVNYSACSQQTNTLTITSTNWLSGWQYRKNHTINSATGAGIGYAVQIIVKNSIGADSGNTVYISGKTRSDFGDIRFTNSTGGLLNYWAESVTNGVNATFWVKIDSDLSTVNQIIYVYYGNSIATSTSNGANTFIYYDNSSSTTGWTIVGSSGQNASDGNPQPSFYAISSNGNYMYKNVNLVPSSLITFNIKSNGLGNFFFMTNSAGLGQLFRSDTRGGTSYSGFNTTTSWTTWNPVNTGFNSVSNAWYKFGISTNTTHATLYYQQTTNSTPNLPSTTLGTYSISNNGGYIGLVGDNLGSSYTTMIDNIIVRKYVSPEPSHGSWGSEETSGTGGLIVEGFEGVTFPPTGWQVGGNKIWNRNTTNPINDTASAGSGDINDSQLTLLNYTVNFLTAGNVSWYWSVSSEVGFDYLCYCIDKACGATGCTCSASGTADARICSSVNGVWTTPAFVMMPVTAGSHSFVWCYAKDSSSSYGDDMGKIDSVRFNWS